MHEAFLDSSIFWSFVGPKGFETEHDACVEVFAHIAVRRFSSETVAREVRETERRKSRLYTDLIEHFQNRKRPEDFPFENYSRHVAERARQLLRRIKGNEADVEYLRRLNQIDQARVREAWSKVQTPLVPSRHDPVFQDTLRAQVGVELADAKILTDYLVWAPAQGPVAFLTVDRALLRRLRQSLQTFLDMRGISRPGVGDFGEPRAFIDAIG